MKNVSIYALLLFATLSQIAWGAETVYISSKEAKIYKEASFASDSIAVLEQNDSVDVVQRDGAWLQVQTSGLKGWVSKYSTTTNEPIKKKISIFTRIKNFFSNDSKRERVALVSTTAGIRGLSGKEGDGSGKKDYDAVEDMESLTVAPEEVDEFVKGNTL